MIDTLLCVEEAEPGTLPVLGLVISGQGEG